MVALMVVYWAAMMVELREHCSVARKVVQKAESSVASMVGTSVEWKVASWGQKLVESSVVQ